MQLVVLAGLANNFAVPTFAQQKETVDPEVRQQIAAIGKKWDEAENNNDAAAIAALFTEDGVFLTDKGPVYGREAIQKRFADDFQEWRHSNHTGKRDPDSFRIIATADDVAENGEWSVTVQGKTGDPIHVKGYSSEIVKAMIGRSVCTFNIAQAPAPATASVETK